VQNPWSIYWAHFKGENSAFIADLIVKNSDDYKPQLTFSEDRIGLFDDIYYNLQNGYGDDTLRYVNMIFYHFLSSMIYEDKFNRLKKTINTDVVDKVIKLMQDKIQQTITLRQMADFSNLSVTHFSSLFRKKTGHSPIEYFNHLKIQKACQYLAFTTMTVKELAYCIGVEDQYYFSRMFTRLMGISPSVYRKRNAENKSIIGT